ncbi:unnamed protein product, partial [Prunus brigantina]
MARNLVGIGDSHADELLPSDAGGLFLFCMILISLSVISAVIFSCGKSSRKKKHNNVPNVSDTGAYYYNYGGDGGHGGGHGHHGHGGGGHGHHGHGGGGHGHHGHGGGGHGDGGGG